MYQLALCLATIVAAHIRTEEHLVHAVDTFRDLFANYTPDDVLVGPGQYCFGTAEFYLPAAAEVQAVLARDAHRFLLDLEQEVVNAPPCPW